MNFSELETEYKSLSGSAEKFCQELTRQLEELIQEKKLTLGFPPEKRIKSWGSIAEKIDRKSLEIKKVSDVSDLIGIRITFLFQRDALAACEMIRENFNVLLEENTSERLGDSQLGYSSIHFHIELKREWLSLPTFKRIGNHKAEIQVRTVAQHIWAAASHLLQYKQETNVPPPIRRAIYRVSALLEMVDLEFERVLIERSTYKDTANAKSISEKLNVDLLTKILDEKLPSLNKAGQEDYADLLPDLFHFSVETPKQLLDLLNEQKDQMQTRDKFAAGQNKITNLHDEETQQRMAKGAFYTHVGLVRVALETKFSGWAEYAAKRWVKRLGKTKL